MTLIAELASTCFTVVCHRSPAEFESKTLRVEKFITGGGTITVQIRPLAAGRYRFFDDYHEDTTEGFLIVQ